MARLTLSRTAVVVLVAALVVASCAAPSERRLVSIREGKLAGGYLQGHLVYVETRGVRESVLFSHDLWTNERKRIRVPAGYADSPSWSPDGRRVAFSLTNRAGNSHIWVINEDGDDAMQLTSGDVVDAHPRWAPNGDYLVFTSIRDGDYDWQLFVVRVPEAQVVSGPTAPAATAPGTPAGNQAGNDMFLRFDAPDGGEVMPLDSGVGHSVFPDWSPDGRTIAYSNRSGDTYNLRVHDVVTGDDRELFDGEGDDMHVRYSPDGTSVIYSTNAEDGLWQIMRHDLVTNGHVRIIGSDSMDEFPTHSYDAQFIAFSTGHLAIYRADGRPFPDGKLRWAVTLNMAWSPDWKAP